MDRAGSRRGWGANLQDLLFGLFLVALAAGTLFTIRKLTMGSAEDMGPGYVPRAVAFGLLAFGVVFTARGLIVAGEAIEPPTWRPLAIIPAAVAVFALSTMTMGLALASFGTMTVAALASRETRFVEILVFAVALSTGAVLLFVQLLSLPVPMFPW